MTAVAVTLRSLEQCHLAGLAIHYRQALSARRPKTYAISRKRQVLQLPRVAAGTRETRECLQNGLVRGSSSRVEAAACPEASRWARESAEAVHWESPWVLASQSLSQSL